jgi:hypothetical protein
MLKEVASYGAVMKVRKPGFFSSQMQSFRAVDLPLQSQSYNPKDPEVRPTGWNELRKRRVHAKERAAGLDSTPTETLLLREQKVCLLLVILELILIS